MYRAGWGEKENQEHILALDIRRAGFDAAVSQAVPSAFSEELGISQEEWRRLVKESDVRVQWDPEKDVNGENLPYRSLQLGLRGQAVQNYVHDWIVSVEDITEYVKRLNMLRKQGEDIADLLPREDRYVIG